jgi:hypothetical protein
MTTVRISNGPPGRESPTVEIAKVSPGASWPEFTSPLVLLDLPGDDDPADDWPDDFQAIIAALRGADRSKLSPFSAIVVDNQIIVTLASRCRIPDRHYVEAMRQILEPLVEANRLTIVPDILVLVIGWADDEPLSSSIERQFQGALGEVVLFQSANLTGEVPAVKAEAERQGSRVRVVLLDPVLFNLARQGSLFAAHQGQVGTVSLTAHTLGSGAF